ncbi:MAG: response regulator transcription factor [Methyloversatilis sp.]|uniref:response regulator n=1 Tax=Methyloversatilis sp. TaxID=2569862 RepID=UPI00273567CF|nr:response regulator transcription factor [Methyloversatilis sp.]MDP2868080.1 response regulator transcription factor [Methyloversatilis sp.]MDP3290165.1 response regulator transcription factor [Methyloversatilis sp.]
MQVMIIEDQPLVVEGLRSVLTGMDSEPDIRCALLASRALSMLRSGLRPDLVLLDLNLPDAGGTSLLTELRQEFPDVPVVVISAQDDRDTITRAIDQGAMGFISKSSNTAILVSALQLVMKGGIYLPQQVLDSHGVDHLPQAHIQDLADIGMTPRQIEVLTLMIEGMPNKLICRELGISDGTCKTHISAILRLLDVRNRTQAIFALSKMGVKLPRRPARD